MDRAIVRPAREEDLPEVAKLAAKLVRLHHAWDPARFMLIEPIEPGYARFLGQVLRDESQVLLVASPPQGGPIAGYVYGGLVPRNWNDLRDACGAIHDIYVDEGARRGGVARALLEQAAARLEAKGAPRIVLLTATQNAAGLALFESLGFRRTMVEMTRERPAREG